MQDKDSVEWILAQYALTQRVELLGDSVAAIDKLHDLMGLLQSVSTCTDDTDASLMWAGVWIFPIAEVVILALLPHCSVHREKKSLTIFSLFF